MTIFRPANLSDLTQTYAVFYANEVKDIPEAPPPGDMPPDLRHVFETGTMYVAEQDGSILAFAAAITRDNITFLTDLFVRPDQQSSQLGKNLLQYVLPQDERIHCTMSSTDPRALALYIRAGMRPQWPNFCLRLDGPVKFDLPQPTDIEIVAGDHNDPEFVRWDAEISGRVRPIDHAFWIREHRAVPLWFKRQGEIVGYGYVRLGAGTLWYPEACTLGPLGTRTAENATSCVLAAVNWACQHANVIRIDVPGPHPCLAPLLSAGFRITYVETHVSSATTPFFDARRYIASGSNFF
jgi:GNAT superfamily N-acetyltransferase